MKFTSSSCKAILYAIVTLLFLSSLSTAQDVKDDRTLSRLQSVASQPTGTDEEFVNGSGYNFDQYLFRKDVPGGRSRFGVFINRYYSNLMKFDANGFLTNPDDLIAKKLLPARAFLTLRVFDVDHDSEYDGNQDGIPDPEVDHIYVNGNRVQDVSGKPLLLSSGDQTWSTWTTEIPIEFLKFPQKLGTASSKPSAENIIEIDIDVTTPGYWAVTCDWIQIGIPSPIRPVMMVHGIFGGPDTWETFAGFFENDGIPHHVPVDGFMNSTGAIANNANSINLEIGRVLNIFGVDKVNLIVHSKGGLDSRMYIRTYGGKHVENLVQIATPNHGSLKANQTYDLARFTGIGMPAAEQLTTWWIERNFNYLFNFSANPSQLVGPRFTEQTKTSIKILAGTLYQENEWYRWDGGLEPPHDGYVSVFSATLPWNATHTYSITRQNDGEFAYDHEGIHEHRDVYQAAINLIQTDFFSTALPTITNTISAAEQLQTVKPTAAETKQVVFKEILTVSANSISTRIVYIEPTTLANFFVGSLTRDFSFRLVDPSGKRFDSNDPNYLKSVDQGGITALFALENPLSGNWRIEIQGDAQALTLIAEVSIRSATTLSVLPDNRQFPANTPFLVSATFANQGTPITNAVVSARLTKANVQEETLSLYDDGSHGDPLANDGVYNNFYSGSNVVGTLDITAQAEKGNIKRIAQSHVAIIPNPRSASLNGIYSDQALDLNGNGLFDVLSINAGVNVIVAGHYSLSGNLRDAAGKLIASAFYASLGQAPLAAGARTLNLSFDGRQINSSGSNGPYKLTDVTLTDLNNNTSIQIDYQEQPFTSKFYSANSFERPFFALTGKNSENTTDTDGDGKFEFLNITLELNVAISGNYNFNAQLVDETGNSIDWAEKSATLAAGINTITLTFDGLEISERGLNGPYTLTNFSIFNDVSGIFQSFLNVYTTLAYLSTQFAGFEIAGIVKERSTGTPIFNAKVILGGKKAALDSTNSAGRFRFGGLPAGNYWVFARLGSENSDTAFVSVPPNANLNISLVASNVLTITSLTPNSGQPGQTLNVAITGANFVNGATVFFSGGGVTVNSTSFFSATQLNANISIAANASLGPRDVIVQNPNGQNGTGSGLFNVIQSSTTCITTFTDDFNDGNANGWKPDTPSQWIVANVEGDPAYVLNVPDVSSDEFSVLQSHRVNDFTLTLSAKATATDNKNFFILFGVNDLNNPKRDAYYLQFGVLGVRLYRIVANSGSEIASHPLDFASDNSFHTIIIRRSGDNITAHGDGVLIIDVSDAAFTSGYVGFGSFKSTACFDDVNLTYSSGGAPYTDDFDDGNATGWTPLTPSRWQVRNDAGSLRYYLNTSDYNSPDEKRLGELSIINSQTWGDFTFECDAKSEDAGIGNSGADLSIVFGYQDFDSYYYVNYNRESGFTEMHRIHDGGPRVTLATYNAPTFNDGNYHKLRIEREGSVIRAYFDGILILSGNDSFFGEGRIGVGSFNDAGYFDNIVITGCKTSGLPNLLGTALSFSQTTYKPGDAITFTGTVMNNGSSPTRPDFRINVFLTDSPTEPDYSLLVHSFTMPALDAGNSNSFTQIGTIPPATPADTYYLWMNIDVDDLNPESNEDDNSFRTNTQLTVVSPPPVSVIKPIVSNPQTSCAEYFVDIRVENVTNLFGVSFVLNYTNTAYVNYVSSENGVFLGNDVLLYANPEDPLGKVSIGVTRKTGQPGSTGSGVIVRVKFSSPASTLVGTPVTFSITDIVGIDPLNNSISLTPQSASTVLNCGITVWPGDTNNDGIVNQADVLPLGLHWNRTGPARSGGSCAWSAQFAAPWTPLAATYADANGDGIVNQADVLCIGLNWGRTHTTASSAPLELADNALAKTAFAEVFAEAVPAQLAPGQEFILKIQAAEARNLFGLAFELQNDRPELLQIFTVEPEALFGEDALLYSHLGETGKSGVGITRKNGQPGAQGAGAVFRLKGKISSEARLGEVITLTLNDIVAQNHEGHVGALPSSSLQLVVGAGANVALQRSSRTVTEYQLYQNYPNPFNPETMIAYDILDAGRVTLRIFNTVGQEVRTLIDETQSPGAYQVRWDGRNSFGEALPSGIYFYRLQAGEFVQIRKMTLVQ